MVAFSFSVLSALKKKPEIRSSRLFIDSLRIHVRGGPGGHGFPKFGGVGGNGGNVYIVSKQKAHLQYIAKRTPSKRFIAAKGTDSSRHNILGTPGKDVEIAVPLGVVVKNDYDRVLGELNEEDQRCLVASGGAGGNPTNSFNGRRGEVRMIRLDLKLIADVGLVGFPNAGKSTFLKCVSRASPKIANYPFTTIRPQLGIMMYPDYRQISVADLPGLIEGAHANFGMGHKFLKHVERTKLLMFIVDLNGFQLSMKYEPRTAFETILLLNKEVELYNPELLDKPAVLLLNKIDSEGGQDMCDKVMRQIQSLPGSLETVKADMHPKRLLNFDEIIPISAKHGHSVDILKERIRKLLDIYADQRKDKESSEMILKQQDTDDMMKSSLSEHRGGNLI